MNASPGRSAPPPAEQAPVLGQLPEPPSPKQRSARPAAAIFCERMHGSARRACPGRSPPVLTAALLLLLLSGLPGLTEAKDCDKPCVNGQCNAATGHCACSPGWVGDQCQHCGGRFRYGPRAQAG